VASADELGNAQLAPACRTPSPSACRRSKGASPGPVDDKFHSRHTWSDQGTGLNEPAVERLPQFGNRRLAKGQCPAGECNPEWRARFRVPVDEPSHFCNPRLATGHGRLCQGVTNSRRLRLNWRAHGSSEEKNLQVTSRQAPRATQARGGARQHMPPVRLAEALAPDLPDLRHVQGPRGRTAPPQSSLGWPASPSTHWAATRRLAK
jgi:hypothetical protein